MAVRRLPQRTCVACRGVKPKREMVRIVRSADGMVMVDPTGKKAGRGAYLCKSPECWREGLRKKALDRALKSEVQENDLAALAEYARKVGIAIDLLDGLVRDERE